VPVFSRTPRCRPSSTMTFPAPGTSGASADCRSPFIDISTGRPAFVFPIRLDDFLSKFASDASWLTPVEFRGNAYKFSGRFIEVGTTGLCVELAVSHCKKTRSCAVGGSMGVSRFTTRRLSAVLLGVAMLGLGSPALQARDAHKQGCGCPAPKPVCCPAPKPVCYPAPKPVSPPCACCPR
jgi:hypothetical protein